MTETEAQTLDQIGDRLLEQVQQLRAEGRWNPPPFEELKKMFHLKESDFEA